MQYQARRSLGFTESLRGKQASLRKTYGSETEANDKVWSLNQETEKALEALAILYERFEQVNSDVDKEVRAMNAVSGTAGHVV